jgi:hypothetical protein
MVSEFLKCYANGERKYSSLISLCNVALKINFFVTKVTRVFGEKAEYFENKKQNLDFSLRR